MEFLNQWDIRAKYFIILYKKMYTKQTNTSIAGFHVKLFENIYFLSYFIPSHILLQNERIPYSFKVV